MQLTPELSADIKAIASTLYQAPNTAAMTHSELWRELCHSRLGDSVLSVVRTATRNEWSAFLSSIKDELRATGATSPLL